MDPLPEQARRNGSAWANGVLTKARGAVSPWHWDLLGFMGFMGPNFLYVMVDVHGFSIQIEGSFEPWCKIHTPNTVLEVIHRLQG